MNLLTVFSIVLMLQTCRTITVFFSYYNSHSGSKETFHIIDAKAGNLTVLYDVAISSYKKVISFAAAAVTDNYLILYSEEDVNPDIALKYVNEIMNNHQLAPSIKVVTELYPFLERLDTLNKKQEESVMVEKNGASAERIKSALLMIAI